VRFLQKRSDKVNKITQCGNILLSYLVGFVQKHTLSIVCVFKSVSIFKFLKT